MEHQNYWQTSKASRYSRRQVIRVGASLALLGVAGCAPTSTPGASSSPGTSDRQPGIKYGGVFNTTTPGDPEHFDPHRAIGLVQDYTHFAHERLLTFKRANSEGGFTSMEVAPMAAQSWEQPDPTTLIFRLKPGLKFHPLPPVNGREVTAEDWVFSLERAKADEPGNVARDFYKPIVRAEAVDKYTLKVVTAEPYAPLLSYLANYYVPVVPKELVAAKGDLKQDLIGAGPFMLKRYEKGNVYTFQKNPEYYVKGFPYLDEINIYNIRDYAAAGTALRSRQMDLLYFARPNAGEEYVKSTPELKTMRWPALGASGFSFNMTKAPFNDVRVRQAFALGWDPDNVGTAVAGKGGYKLEGLFPSGLGDWSIPRDDLPFQKRDVNKAKQLLAEAGVRPGTKVMMSIGWYPLGKTVGEVMQQDLRAIDIDLELVPSPDRNAELQLVQEMKWDLSWNGYSMSTSPALEPDEIVTSFHTKSPTNFAGRGTPEIDKLIEEQRRTLDRPKRKAILLDIQKKLAERVEIVRGPAIHYYALWWPYLRNYEHDYRSFTGDFHYCWLDK